MPEIARWTIELDKDGYVIQLNGLDSATLFAQNINRSVHPFIVSAPYDEKEMACHWEFIQPPRQLLFYSSSGSFIQNPTYYVTPETSKSLNELSLNVQLCPEVYSTQQIAWTTSNSAVATVDAITGTVTGVAYGNATITATYYSSSGCTTSNSYLLKVTPLPEGIFYISNKQTEKYMDSISAQLEDKDPLFMNELSRKKTQRWILEHEMGTLYSIKLDTEEGDYYLGLDRYWNEAGTAASVRIIETGSYIPMWEITTTSSGAYKIRYRYGDYYLQQKINEDGGFDTVYQNTYTVDQDYLDEWEFERVYSLSIQVYYDEYVDGYGADYDDGIANIEDQLEILKQTYWDQFRISIDIIGPTLIETYVNECPTFAETGECQCGDCANSTSPNVLMDYHHTNLRNIMYRMPLPQEPVDAVVLYIGHQTCNVRDGRHTVSMYYGLTNYKYNIIAMNNIKKYSTSQGAYIYNQVSCTKTLVHEIGHLFRAPDHYANSVQSTTDINASDREYAGLYDSECIFGEEKDLPNVAGNLIICEGCKADIIKNRHRFIDYASSSTVRGT